MKKIIRKYFTKKCISFIFLLFFAVLVLGGCSKEQKINEETFVKIYSDLVIAQDSLAMDSTAFVNEKKKIFTRYSVSKELYVKTLEYYKKHPDEWKALFEKVIAYLREKEKKKP